MSDAVLAVQTAALAALAAHPGLNAALTGIFDGVPVRQPFPYIVINNGLVSDWGTKTALGREIRLSLTVWDDGEEASRVHQLMGHIEEAMAALPRDLPGWRIASCVFLRSLIARDPAGPWAGVVDHRIRLLSAS